MNEMLTILGNWQLDLKTVRKRMYGAPTPRERERWHAIWLLARGWSAAQVAEALERDAYTIGDWQESLRQQGPGGLTFEQGGGSPRPHTGTTGGIEGSRAGCAQYRRDRLGHLDLERSGPIRERAV